MKAMLEARIVAAKTHGLASSAQGRVAAASLIAVSSQGAFTIPLWMRLLSRSVQQNCEDR
jgi:hypothetical protein